jgi:hypothetical protein
MDKNITTLDTARMLEETTALLGDISSACAYLGSVAAANFAGPVHESTVGVINIIAYAANAAYDKQHDFTENFMDACGFEYPLRGDNAGNIQIEIVLNKLQGGSVRG